MLDRSHCKYKSVKSYVSSRISRDFQCCYLQSRLIGEYIKSVCNSFSFSTQESRNSTDFIPELLFHIENAGFWSCTSSKSQQLSKPTQPGCSSSCLLNNLNQKLSKKHTGAAKFSWSSF